MMNILIIAFGSNVGPSDGIISTAIDLLGLSGLRMINLSRGYLTKSISVSSDADYYNCVGIFRSHLGIEEVFATLKDVEMKLGRVYRRGKWQAREIDLDLLFFNDISYKSDRLVVPHVGIFERDFVCIPLIDVLKKYEGIYGDFYANMLLKASEVLSGLHNNVVSINNIVLRNNFL